MGQQLITTPRGQRVAQSGQVEQKHPASRLECFLQRAKLDVTTIRCPTTGRIEVALIAENGFDEARTRRALEQALAPATKAQLGQWLVALAAITISRQRDNVDHKLIAVIFVERLAPCPADIVEHVMLRERWKFLPTIAELEEAAEAFMPRRRLVAQLLDHGRIWHRAELEERDRSAAQPELVTPEAKRRISAEIFGGALATADTVEEIASVRPSAARLPRRGGFPRRRASSSGDDRPAASRARRRIAMIVPAMEFVHIHDVKSGETNRNDR